MRSILLAAGVMAALPAFAADPLNEAGVSIRAGAFRSEAETTIRVDSSGGVLGTTLSFEDDLGFQKTKTLPQVDLIWRINPRHRLELGYTRLARDSRKTITGEIRFGDAVFPVNTSLDSTFDSSVMRLAYGYSFYRDGGNELSVLVGLHVTGLETRLSSSGGQIAETADRTLPLPTLGLQGAWAFDDRWRLAGWAQVFAIEYGDYGGSLVNGQLSAEYRLSKNVALGAGWTVYDYNVDVEKGRARGKFDYLFSGPMLYVTAGF